MRSSKSRQRSKQNRPRSLGNIINRVFDSSGPEGKVRGTPAQLIEKYQFLARDAQLSNDRVAAENFLQHAEHYTRLLAEANRELAAEQEARQQFQNQQGGNGGQNNGQNRDHNRDQRRDDRGDYRSDYRGDASDDQPSVAAHDMVDALGEGDTGLVETPEAGIRPVARPDDNRRSDRPRYDRPRDDQGRRSYPPRVDQAQMERGERSERNEQRPDRNEPRGERPKGADPRPPRPAEAAQQPEAPATPVEAPRAEEVKSAAAPKTRSRAPKKATPTEAASGEPAVE